MTPQQQVALAVNAAIYAGLIAFVLYREMSEHQLRLPRLVLAPAILGLFALQQLGRQHLNLGPATVAFLAANVNIGAAAGVWRGTTFRIWSQAGSVRTKGTTVTLVSWGVLIAVRLPFLAVSHVAKMSEGVVIGELLLALAATFAAQNVVLWLRVGRGATALTAGAR